MPIPDAVAVVGASAGGVEALSHLVEELRPDLAAAVLVVLHTGPSTPSVLPAILDRAGSLPASAAQDGEEMEAGHIYIAPSDHHLEVADGHIRLSRGPKINGVRPAVDVLFRSAADAYGPRTVAAVLSGTRDDGTIGASSVKLAGGRAYAQSLDDAQYPGMPGSAARFVDLDGVASARELGRILNDQLRTPPGEEVQDEVAERTLEAQAEPGGGGASGLTCPDCGGAIWEEQEGVGGFACHEGHSYAPQSFALEQARLLERALWTASRTLDERAALLRKLAERIAAPASPAGDRYEAAAKDAETHARTIRETMLERGPAVPAAEAS